MSPLCCTFTTFVGLLFVLCVHGAVEVVRIYPSSSTTTLLHKVDKRFLSFAIDSHGLVKGWKDVNLTNERIIYLTQKLHPAYLRIGGTDADIIEFVPTLPQGTSSETFSCKIINCDGLESTKNDSSMKPPSTPAYVPGKDFITLGNFVKSTRTELIYGLNVLLRMKNGTRWNTTNARDLMRFLSRHKIPVFGWELGNEPDSFKHVFNVTVTSSRLAKDFGVLKNLTQRFPLYRYSNIIGPDTVRPAGKRATRYLRGFLRHGGGETVDKVSFHQYYFSGHNASVNDFINITTMNVLRKEIKRAAMAVKRFAPGKPLWIGETGSGWGGGCRNISDRFASSFLWLDKLGLAAYSGVQVVFRQTLMGGSYGLLDVDGLPTPDYYISILHKRLVGTRVLNVPVESTIPSLIVPQGLRVYFHCSRELAGALTIFGLNVESYSDIRVEIPGNAGLIIQEYLIQAPSLSSRYSYLNGFKLKLRRDGGLPALNPALKSLHFDIPKLSMGFWVLPNANVSWCLR